MKQHDIHTDSSPESLFTWTRARGTALVAALAVSVSGCGSESDTPAQPTTVGVEAGQPTPQDKVIDTKASQETTRNPETEQSAEPTTELPSDSEVETDYDTTTCHVSNYSSYDDENVRLQNMKKGDDRMSVEEIRQSPDVWGYPEIDLNPFDTTPQHGRPYGGTIDCAVKVVTSSDLSTDGLVAGGRVSGLMDNKIDYVLSTLGGTNATPLIANYSTNGMEGSGLKLGEGMREYYAQPLDALFEQVFTEEERDGVFAEYIRDWANELIEDRMSDDVTKQTELPTKLTVQIADANSVMNATVNPAAGSLTELHFDNYAVTKSEGINKGTTIFDLTLEASDEDGDGTWETWRVSKSSIVADGIGAR